ncbi:MAG: two-component system, OmpR family, phosphate regulon response regulator PhoB [Deferribacteres bacterium]|jgi:two-component system phosphate regulon response regulator PhoB|nr:two component transcriptional regulator, winged helix family [Deferribacteraceae bacterium]MDK2791310.1 two-component system, OmpR family, phosphate regulon response regulator PhoB [Deferribacteres bacterium]
MSSRVLIIEDEEDLRELIRFNLQKESFIVESAADANEALIFLDEFFPDIILLDLMLPGLKGMQFLKLLKDNPKYKNIPVVVVSAKNSENDIVLALESGADDYVTKPFSLKVLIAKIKIILKKQNKDESKLIFYAGVELNENLRCAKIDGQEINLTHKEFELLALLLSNPKRVFTRNQLLSNVWGYDSDVFTRTVDSHISSIRKKLGNKAEIIKSVPKIGYKVE